MLLEIAQLGQAVLRQVAAPVSQDEILTPDFQAFLDEMRETMTEAKGVGLAAPQVFVSCRVFLARIEPLDPEKPDELPPIEVFINPVLTFAGEEKVSAWEGCLSFQELLVLVPRHRGARVEYLDASGNKKAVELTDFAARVVQHENDHLDGVLTLDRAVSTLDIVKASEIEDVVAERKRVRDNQNPAER